MKPQYSWVRHVSKCCPDSKKIMKSGNRTKTVRFAPSERGISKLEE
jgi:hypothetical protein